MAKPKLHSLSAELQTIIQAESSKKIYIAVWDSTVTYSVDEACYYLGKFYKSLLSGNINNTPDTSLSYWQNINVGGGVGQSVLGVYSGNALELSQEVNMLPIDMSPIISSIENYKIGTRILVLLLHMEGIGNNTLFLDDRANPKFVYTMGSVRYAIVPKTVIGDGMIRFNGADAFTTPDSEDFNFGSGDFLVESYIQLDSISTTSTYKCIIGQRTSSSSNNSFNIYIHGGIPNRLYVSMSYTGASQVAIEWLYDFKPFINYHIAVARIGSYMYGFVDGSLIGTYYIGANALFNSTNVLTIGASNIGATEYFTGFMQELRVLKGSVPYVITQEKPTVESMIDSDTKLLLHMNGTDGETTFTDETTKAVTVNGHTCTKSAQSVFGGTSAYFDGTDDYLTVANSSDLELGGDDFSIDFWAYFSATSTPRTIFSKCSSASSYDGYILYFTSTGNLTFNASTNGTSMNVSLTNPIDVVINQWYHIAIVRKGGSWTMYIDGIPVSSSFVSGAIIDSGCDLMVGNGIGRSVFMGYLDEFRIKKGTTIWSSNFTLPTVLNSPTTNGTVLLIHGVGASGDDIVDSSNSVHALTKIGNPYVWNVMSKFTNTSAFFNGASYLKIDDNNDFNLETHDFTIDFWMNLSKLPTVSSSYCLMCHRGASGSKEAFTLSIYNNAGTTQLKFQYSVAGTTLVSSIGNFAMIPHAWYHIAVVRYGTSIKVYGNGVCILTLAIGATDVIYNTTYPLFIGAANNSGTLVDYFLGFMDEFRFIKGEAIWTSDFTPNSVEYISE